MSKGPGGAYVLPPLKWHESPNFSHRLYHNHPVQGYLHFTAGRYAGDIATLTAAGGNSAHIVLREDGNEATQLVPWLQKAWTQTVGNDAGISIEMSCLDYPEKLWAGWSVERRQECLDQWHTAARIQGFWCVEYAIPPRWSMVHGGPYAPGLMRHRDLQGLGSPPSTHGDPTAKIHGEPSVHRADGSPSWLWWVALVQHEVERGSFLASWGRP